ncbi:MAG TPA: hypothetical protein ENI95_12235, partial [Chloroflexi bacterium]|nr:hypothetical protein [Chloroflexota bacterium]
MLDELQDQEQEREEGARSGTEEALDLLQVELERVNAELRDISSKLEQSRGLVEQLAKRNATVIGEVRRIEGMLEQTPRLSIKEVYTEALNIQQRLLTTRAQLEKLQAQEVASRREAQTLQAVIELLSRKDESKEGEGDTLSARETIIRVIDAQELERERLAKQMHDGPAQSLTNFILQAEICEKLFDRDADKAREELARLKESAGEAFKRVRGFI